MLRRTRIIDLSHTSVDTQRQVLALSKAPVIFSHSSCSAITSHARNSPDDILDALKINGGVFMVSFLRKLTDSNNPSLQRVADHVQHVGERIGYAHVGIGSDFDGVMQTADGLDNVSKFPHLIAELLQRGVSKKEIEQLAGLNVLRVIDDVSAISKRMISAGLHALQDHIEPIWSDEVRDEVKKVRGIA